MTIACSKCGHIISSVILEKMLAWQECYQALTKHVMRQHPKELQVLASRVTKVAAGVGLFMTVSEFAIVPDEEEFINTHLEEVQEVIMMAAGFDPTEDLEEEEEDSEDEENDKEESDVTGSNEVCGEEAQKQVAESSIADATLAENR